MVLAQAPAHHPTMNNLLFHLNSIFQDPVDSPRCIVVSQSKIDKGDATFNTKQRLLGWDVDSHSMHIRLPTHRVDRLRSLLHTYSNCKHTTCRKWQRLLGELRSMTLAIHSTQYMFCALQYPLLATTSHRFRIPGLARQALHDWNDLLTTLQRHPVPIAMVIPHAPHYWAASDASGVGMGGFWMPSNITKDTQPCIWRYQLPDTIKSCLLTPLNPTGTITINDLELAAAQVGFATQSQHAPLLPFTSTCLATDNTAAAAWLSKGSTTSAGPPAYLLPLMAQACRSNNSALSTVYTPGNTNHIADFLSRSFHLSNDELLQLVHEKLSLVFSETVHDRRHAPIEIARTHLVRVS